MRPFSLFLYAAVVALALLPAGFAQAQDSGGARVVVDPATGNVRVINPDYANHGTAAAPSGGASVIHLHMPRAEHRKSAAKPAATPAPAATVSDTNGFSAPESNFPTLGTPAPPPAKPAAKAAAAAAKAKAPRIATAAPPPAHITQAPGRRIHVLFPPGAPAPAPGAAASLKSVAVILNSSLQSGSNRVQLEAYGGKPNDTSSEARRLSLRRALAVRQLLIDAGLPSSRIDVHALGGASDGGAPDRVDIFVHA